MCPFPHAFSLLLLLMTIGCASAKTATQIAQVGDQEREETPLWSAAAVDAALAAPPDRELRLATDCRSEGGFVSAVIYGHGVAIWDRRIQTRLDERVIRRLLDAFHAEGFTAMHEVYGGRSDPETKVEMGLELICRVEIARGALIKQVVQLSEGRQHGPLFALAEEMLDAVAAERDRGVAATSLGDGLTKLATGELAAEVLELGFLEQPERPGEGGKSRQWTLRGGELAVGSAESSVRRFLEANEIVELARELADAGVQDWPGNLFAETYIDFSVAVLGFEKSVQARGFEGMSSQTHGDAQRQFERTLAHLRQLPD